MYSVTDKIRAGVASAALVPQKENWMTVKQHPRSFPLLFERCRSPAMVDIPMANICQICSTAPSKYRCPTCRTQTYVPEPLCLRDCSDHGRCSLGCTKLHKLQCDDTSNSDNVVNEKPADAAEGIVTSNTASEPHEQFRNLKDSHHLSKLFEKYPTLRIQLNQLYQVATEPSTQYRSRQMYQRGRHGQDQRRGHFSNRQDPRSDHWTPEEGYKNALSMLNDRLKSNSSEHDGLREYAELVLLLCPSHDENADSSNTSLVP